MTDTCEKHCEATAFKIVIRGLEGEVARLVAAKTWVGLTDEEFDDLRDNNFGVSPLISAVEAKLKEKNT